MSNHSISLDYLICVFGLNGISQVSDLGFSLGLLNSTVRCFCVVDILNSQSKRQPPLVPRRSRLRRAPALQRVLFRFDSTRRLRRLIDRSVRRDLPRRSRRCRSPNWLRPDHLDEASHRKDVWVSPEIPRFEQTHAPR